MDLNKVLPYLLEQVNWLVPVVFAMALFNILTAAILLALVLS